MRPVPHRPRAGLRRRWFFVAAAPGQQYHVETDGDCEEMLCGLRIPVDGPEGGRGPVIQSWWGPKKCPDCFLLFGKMTGSLP